MDIEMKRLFKEQHKAFSEFKKANDERLDQLEARGNTDPLLEEKVDRAAAALATINDQLTELEKSMNRAGGTGAMEDKNSSHKSQKEWGLMLQGIVSEDALQRKNIAGTADSTGGYVAPEEISVELMGEVATANPIYALADRKETTKSKYSVIRTRGGVGSGYVSETGERPKTSTPVFHKIIFSRSEVYANPAATQEMVDDVEGLVETINGMIVEEFGDQQSQSFLDGNGTDKPSGMLSGTLSTDDDSTRTFGEIQKMVAAAVAAITGDELIDLQTSLATKYQNFAVWLMNAKTWALIRKLKDSDGNYLVGSLADGAQPSLLGKPVWLWENMEDATVGNVPIIYGNIKKAYRIVDRSGVRILVDPYTSKPLVLYYATARQTAAVIEDRALKVLEMAAS